MRVSWFGRGPHAVRLARLETRHAARLAEIHAGAFAHGWEETEFERLLVDRAVTADGLFRDPDPEPIGFAVSRRVLDEAEILTIAVASTERRRGYGRVLLEHHLNNLAAARVHDVHLEVEDGNAAAVALYRRAGFTEVGRRIGYYRKPDGSRACALTMQRRLGPG